MKKNNKLFVFILLLSVSFITTVLESCGNQKEEKDNIESITKKTNMDSIAMADSTIKPEAKHKPDTDPVFQLPIFEVSRTEIEKYYGAGKRNPKKFIIRIEFGDITELTLTNSKLLLYPAKNHQEYAAKQYPLEVPATEEMSAEMNSNVIIGGVEFDGAGKLLQNGSLKEFVSLRLTPKLTKGDDGRENHLIFNVSLITAEKKVVDLGDTNPSPPKTPGY